jgi:hypothetical protein
MLHILFRWLVLPTPNICRLTIFWIVTYDDCTLNFRNRKNVLERHKKGLWVPENIADLNLRLLGNEAIKNTTKKRTFLTYAI